MRILKRLILVISTSLVIYYTMPVTEDIDNTKDTWYYTVEDEVVAYYKSIGKPIPNRVIFKNGTSREIKFEELFLWKKD